MPSFAFAWMRYLSVLILLPTLARAQAEQTLFTSSVTYCSPPESLLIQQFDVAYFAHNQSVFFNISAASVDPNLNVTASVLVSAYSIAAVNTTIELCGLLDGFLCPLPMYNFTGSDTLTLEALAQYTDRIPAIAYQIPDLEAYIQLQFLEVGTGKVKACVQATLSNGKSTHHPAVEWSTGTLALIALASAAWQSLAPDALAPYRLLDLMYLYQSIAISGLLNLNYPSLYRQFTLNFSWALGLFPTQTTSSMQLSIDSMRKRTGGKLATASVGGAVGLVNRKLSPYNIPAPGGSVEASPSFSLFAAVPPASMSYNNLFASNDASYGAPMAKLDNIRTLAQVATVTEDSSTTLQAGVPIFVNSINIDTANAFMTVFFVALIMVGIAISIFALGYGALLLMEKFGWKQGRAEEMRIRFPSFAKAWTLRLCIIALPPILIFSFYEWTLKDSWLAVLLSVILVLAAIAAVAYPSFLTMRLAKRDSPYALYSHPDHLSSYGPLYAQYRTPRYYSFAPLLAAMFFKAIFIAFAKGNATVQIAFMIIVDLFVFLANVVLKPHKTRGGDVLSTYLSIVRLVTTALMAAFLETARVKSIVRAIIGAVIILIFGVAVIVVFINLMIHLPFWKLLRKKQSGGSERTLKREGSGDDSMLEKAQSPSSADRTSETYTRPSNPGPDQNMLLDASINRPYPTSSLTDASFYSQGTSAMSGSTTLGSILPRRWSWQQVHSPNGGTPPSPAFLSSSAVSRQSELPSAPRTPTSASRPPTVDENHAYHHNPQHT